MKKIWKRREVTSRILNETFKKWNNKKIEKVGTIGQGWLADDVGFLTFVFFQMCLFSVKNHSLARVLKCFFFFLWQCIYTLLLLHPKKSCFFLAFTVQMPNFKPAARSNKMDFFFICTLICSEYYNTRIYLTWQKYIFYQFNIIFLQCKSSFFLKLKILYVWWWSKHFDKFFDCTRYWPSSGYIFFFLTTSPRVRPVERKLKRAVWT